MTPSRGTVCVVLSLQFNWAQEMMEFSITLNIKALECQCGIDLPDPQSCLTVWTYCPPLESQTGSLARQQNSLEVPNWIGGFLFFIAESINSTIWQEKKRTIKSVGLEKAKENLGPFKLFLLLNQSLHLLNRPECTKSNGSPEAHFNQPLQCENSAPLCFVQKQRRQTRESVSTLMWRQKKSIYCVISLKQDF